MLGAGYYCARSARRRVGRCTEMPREEERGQALREKERERGREKKQATKRQINRLLSCSLRGNEFPPFSSPPRNRRRITETKIIIRGGWVLGEGAAEGRPWSTGLGCAGVSRETRVFFTRFYTRSWEWKEREREKGYRSGGRREEKVFEKESGMTRFMEIA